MPWRAAVIVACAALTWLPSVEAQTPAAPVTPTRPASSRAVDAAPQAPEAAVNASALPLSLVTTYADGRVTESLVSPRGHRAWTPYFPRVTRWRDAPGTPPVTALNLVARVEGQGLRVWVSVLRGANRDVDDAVAEVRVGLGDRVRIDALERVGLRAIEVSAKAFAMPALHVPRGSSRVGGLVVEGVVPEIEPTPGYQITVRNQTEVPLVTLAFESYAAGRRALSGQQGDPSAQPIAAAGETFTFRLGIISSPDTGRATATAMPLDDIVVAGALWADGKTAGDPARTGPMLALHGGRLAALREIVPLLRNGLRHGDTVTALRLVRDAIAAVPTAADAVAVASMAGVSSPDPRPAASVGPAVTVGSQNVRTRLLSDIDRVLPGITPATAAQWLAEALPACEAWMRRLEALFAVP